MASLGDIFPDNLKGSVISGNLKTGSVFRLFDNSTNPPKIKRFVVVGISSDCVMFATVFINTHINPNLFKTPILQSLHYPISAVSCKFINHDSFVDCSQIIEKGLEDVKTAYQEDMQSHLGDLSVHDLAQIQQKIQNAHTIAPILKQKYGLQ